MEIWREVGISGKYTLINNELVDALDKAGLWTTAIIYKLKRMEGSVQNINEVPQSIKDVFKTAYELHPKWLIAANARRQKVTALDVRESRCAKFITNANGYFKVRGW